MKNVLKKILNVFKKIFHVLRNYFYNIGKELKEWVINNWKEILYTLIGFMIVPLFFILPKITLMIVVSLFSLLILLIISLIIWDSMITSLNESKYPYLITTIHVLLWLSWMVIGGFAMFIVNKSIYFAEV